jgi:ligand-binding sensor domain-containing protein
LFSYNYRIYFFFLVNIFTSTANAQTLPDLKFTHINSANGLSTDFVRNILQDSRGIIWICTIDGLNRYDGHTFKIYKQIPGNPNSLPGNDIWNIKEDKKGNFWVGTQTGLCYFEPAKNRFTNFLHDPKNANSMAYIRAENLMVDEEDNLWVGSLNGLQKFNLQTKKFQLIQFATKEELAQNVNAQAVYHIYLDNKKQLWVVAGGNLFLVDRHTLTYKKMLSTIISNLSVNAIFQESDGQYWLCYWGKGFSKYDGVQPPSQKDFIVNNGIYYRIVNWKDINNIDWLVLTTTDDGICFYNKEKNIIQYFLNDITKPNSFVAHQGAELMVDNRYNLWFTTEKGLEILEPGKQFFTTHYLGEKKDREDYYSYGTPLVISREAKDYWVSLWNGQGLIKLDSNWKEKKRYKSIPEHSLNNTAKNIFSIYKDSKKDYWITTNEGLVKFNEEKNSFKLYIPTDVKTDAYECRKLVPLGKNRLFMRTRHFGLYVFNTDTGLFEKHFTKENSKLPHNDVNDMAYDKKGNLWVATAEGLCKLDTTNFTIEEIYKKEKNNIKSLANDFCRSLDIDADENIWIGTINGLSKLSKKNYQFTNYTTADGLCNNFINYLVVDKNNNVWMITQNGVSFFNQKKNKFQNFYKEDGLPKNALDGKLFKDDNGTVYLTDLGIIMTLNPDNIPFNKNKPTILITDAAIKDSFYPLQINSSGEKYLETNFKNSNISINFAVLNFNSPNLNTYYYKLEGIDNDWHKTDRGIASYISIPPGNYTLKVKGSNNSGIINEEGDFMNILIVPEWYQTFLFKLLCVLALAALIFYFMRMRIKTIRKEATLKQKIAETEMEALRAQMNPHFIFNCLNSIENFIMQNEKRLASDYLNKFSRLIRIILESNQESMVPISADIEALQLYIELEQLRFKNKFTYQTNIDEELLNGDYRVPPLLIQPFVENAILHGIAHSDKPSNTLTINASLKDAYVNYTIEDNGIGRKKAADYNFLNKPNHKSVGLYITQERIELHNNEPGNSLIKITDLFNTKNEANGTRVEVNIKIK